MQGLRLLKKERLCSCHFVDYPLRCDVVVAHGTLLSVWIAWKLPSVTSGSHVLTRRLHVRYNDHAF